MIDFVPQQIKTFGELEILLKQSPISHDYELIKKAFNYSHNIHKDQFRESGEPFIEHPLTVAGYIAELGLDDISICAALLHDSIEKGNGNIEEIDKMLGTEVAFIVDGLTTIRSLSKNLKHADQFEENFNNLIFNSSEDIRIIIIRLAEKLHNILNIGTLSEDRSSKSAKKILNIYGPMAEYVGLASFKRIMEDEAFRIINPNEFAVVKRLVDITSSNAENIIKDFETEVSEILNQYGLKNYEFYGRRKGIYSAYKKIKGRYLKPDESITDKVLTDLKDVYGFRLIVNTIEECYLALGLLHSKYEYSKDDFSDYISMPKENGYKSINSVFSYKGAFLEVQIRTHEMHEFNEFGPASHIAYKLQGSIKNNQSLTWTKDLTTWKDKSTLKKEDFQIKAFQESVFIFTPKGLVIRLPKGSTPLDFAFRIHTDLGSKYQGAIVNAKMVNLDYKLKTGDVIEILAGKKDNLTADWIKHCATASAQARIRKKLRMLGGLN
jgi:guanosine-3',5'-bis(diphosphate) 3'-pyrophosphohydrolase